MAEAIKLAKSSLNGIAGSSKLSRLRRELRNLNASYNIVEATKISEITEKAKKKIVENSLRTLTKSITQIILH